MRRDVGQGGQRLPAVVGVLVHLAARVLPFGAVRDRYEREFTAELHDLRPTRQLRYAFGLLRTAGSLRHALRTKVPSPLGIGVLAYDSRPLWCRVNLHRWTRCWTEDGGRFQRCDRCGTDRYRSFEVNWPILGGWPR
jgi:hypothetical protein